MALASLSQWVLGPRPATHHERAWQDFMGAYAWFLGLQILDLASTVMVLQAGGGEANPFGVAVLAAHGPAGLLGMKLVLILLSMAFWTSAFAWLVQRGDGLRATRVCTGLIVALTLFYTLVVYHNLVNLRILGAA